MCGPQRRLVGRSGGLRLCRTTGVPAVLDGSICEIVSATTESWRGLGMSLSCCCCLGFCCWHHYCCTSCHASSCCHGIVVMPMTDSTASVVPRFARFQGTLTWNTDAEDSSPQLRKADSNVGSCSRVSARVSVRKVLSISSRSYIRKTKNPHKKLASATRPQMGGRRGSLLHRIMSR